ncbi:MAG: hypothetical protein HQM15_01160 [Deltaproteobacteria bacterium]|nr:hypothetical protein [Deltaproteobacteria bacterium]
MTSEKYPNQKEMELIWAQIPKETQLPPGLEGEYIRYLSTDPRYLYNTGFVDNVLHKLEDWEAAFLPFKQPDASFLLSKDNFLSLGKFRYTGFIRRPVDVMKIRDGWYDLKIWREFLVRDIIPSTTKLSEEDLDKGTQESLKQGRIKEDRILVDESTRRNLKLLMDQFPSPTRMREMALEKAYQEIINKAQTTQNKAKVSTTYDRGPKVGDVQKKDLKEILVKSSKIASSAEQKPTVSLKDLQKQSRGSGKMNG